MTKKILSLALAVIMAATTFSFSAFAADKKEEISQKSDIERSRKDELNESAYNKLENLYRRNDLIVEAIKNNNFNFEEIIKSKFSYDDLKVQAVNEVVAIRIEQINNTRVIFNNDGTFFIDTIEEKENSKGNLKSISNANYKTASNKFEARGAMGNLVWEAYIEAEFGYDGEKAWVNGEPYGYYKRGILSLWQVSDWNVGWTNYEGSLGARAYARGNFHFGIEYDGNGLVIQDIPLDLRVSCNYKGKIFKNSGI